MKKLITVCLMTVFLITVFFSTVFFSTGAFAFGGMGNIGTMAINSSSAVKISNTSTKKQEKKSRRIANTKKLEDLTHFEKLRLKFKNQK